MAGIVNPSRKNPTGDAEKKSATNTSDDPKAEPKKNAPARTSAPGNSTGATPANAPETGHDATDTTPPVTAVDDEKRKRRRLLALGAAVTFTVIGIGIVVIPNDSDPTGATPAQTREAVTIADAIVDHINVPSTPENPTTETLLTPAGEDWWDLVTSVGTDSQLWEAPVPTTANWYALNTTKNYKTNDPAHPTTQTIHIAFPTKDDAVDYLNVLGKENVTTATSVLRDNLLTLTPSWIDPNRQPFPTLDGNATKATQDVPDIAYWHHNIGETHELHIEENKSPEHRKALTEFYTNLGFTDSTTWTLTTTDSTEAWEGIIENYNADGIDIAAAREVIQATNISECTDTDNGDGTTSSVCETVDFGVSNLTNTTAWATPPPPVDPNAPKPPKGRVPGNGEGTTLPPVLADDTLNYLPMTAPIPDGITLAFGSQLTAEKGVLTGTGLNYEPPVPLIKGTITTDGDTNYLTLTTSAQTVGLDWELLDEDDPYLNPELTQGPMDVQTGKPTPLPDYTPPVPGETTLGDDTPGYSIDENGLIIPDETPTMKPPKGMEIPSGTATPKNVPLPPIPTPNLTTDTTAIPANK